MIPYGRQSVDEDDIAAVVDVLRSDWLTTGPTLGAFEQALSGVTGGHPVVAVSSGSAALHCAYAAAGLGPGTTLVTTPLTFVATAAMGIHLGADVVFADIDDKTLCIDPKSVEKVLTSDTRVIAGVDYAGHPCNWPALRELADGVGAVLIDDAAHALGTTLHDRPTGDWADLTTFSFHPVKTITTAEGGAVVVRQHQFLEDVRRLRNHGMQRETAELDWPDEGPWHQEVHRFGFNYRMPDVNAALGLSQLRRIDSFISRRRELAERYRWLLRDQDVIHFQDSVAGARPALHLFPIRVPQGQRRRIFDRLRAAGIGVQVHYLPVHLHPAFTARGYRRDTCPVAEEAYTQLVSLPLYPTMEYTAQDRVVRELLLSLP